MKPIPVQLSCGHPSREKTVNGIPEAGIADLPTYVADEEDGTFITRWSLTADERRLIAEGHDVYLHIVMGPVFVFCVENQLPLSFPWLHMHVGEPLSSSEMEQIEEGRQN